MHPLDLASDSEKLVRWGVSLEVVGCLGKQRLPKICRPRLRCLALGNGSLSVNVLGPDGLKRIVSFDGPDVRG